MTSVRTRIAPSPTGQDLHIGNAYTALINYVFAKKNNGQFVVRIEDTDRTRFVEGSEKRILESLHWLGLDPDESTEKGGPYKPYRQSERLDIYKKNAEELVEKGRAYYCFCTQERLEQMRKDQEAHHLPPMYDGICKKFDPKESKKRVGQGEKHVIRLNVPEEGITVFHDIIRGDISFENKLIDDQVLLKSDGFPTYHLGVVVDDHIMKISHIIRGEEWISSTPKHILLYQFFGWKPPVFAHMPLLRNPDKSKLSKRKNPVWVSDYRMRGFEPKAIINYLGSMAWSYSDGREIFTIDEMMSVFKLEDVKTTAPIFDQEKLRWMNGEYLNKLTNEELAEKIISFISTVTTDANKVDRKVILEIMPLIRPRMKIMEEFWPLAGFFFQEDIQYEREIDKNLLYIAINALSNVSWKHDSMEKSIRDAAVREKVRARDVFMELRLAVTGKTVGPPLLESLEILGREKILERIQRISSLISVVNPSKN